MKILNEINEGKETSFTLFEDGILHLEGRLCVPKDEDTLQDTRYTLFSPPRSNKDFWWNRMKKDEADYVSKSLTSQKVKAEHRHPIGELQLIELP